MSGAALDLARRIRGGEHSAVAVLDATLARIRAADARYNCFTAITEDRARQEAAAIDARRARGDALPPLAGVPYAVKNLFDIAEEVTLAGGRVNAANPAAPRDATLVAQLADGLARRIDEQGLRPGTRLPSIRKMAEQSGVSRFTVVEAYDRLVARGLGQHGLGCQGIVQHLVDGDEIVGVALHRRRKDVALAHLRVGDAGLVEIGARHAQHLTRHVNADAAPVERREDFQHPPGAGAEVQHGLERPLADQLQQRGLHRAVGDVQRAYLVPACRVLAEIGGGPLLPAALDRRQPLQVALDLRVGIADAGYQPQHEIARAVRVRQAEEGPGALLVAADQSRLQKKLEMARHARLRLAQDLGEV